MALYDMTVPADLAEFQPRTLEMAAGKTLAYRLFIPRNYRPTEKYPLMLTLHGAGECGHDNRSQLAHHFNRMWAGSPVQDPHPAFVVAPQCPADGQWVNTPWSNGSYDADKIAVRFP